VVSRTGAEVATDRGGHAGEALPLAERVVDRALKAGATEAEVLIIDDDSALTRFANSEIHQNVAEKSVLVNLRFAIGKRIAVASTGRTDDEGLRSLVQRAAEIAPNVEELEDWGGLPEPDGMPLTPQPLAYVAGTAAATPESRATEVRAVIGAADGAGVLAFGSFRTAAETVSVANSRGIRASERRTLAHLITVHMSPDGGNGYAEAASTDVAEISGAALGAEAAGKARASDHAVAIEPGEYPVVLEEYAVVDIVDQMGYLGFSASAVQEGRSFFEPGKRIGSDLVTIVDDASDPNGTPAGFDYEGVRKQRVPWIERGVCVDVLYDAQTAARAGRRSTGHAYPAPNPYGPLPGNIVMNAGSSARGDLIASLDRGLLVTRFHYTNTVHPKLAITTGMTRDGTFLVEGGVITGPVKNLRFTQSYLDALAGVSAVARERKTVVGGFGGVVVPALRIDAWTFTGATEH
jgi:predicted Zn-dependent protease